MIVLLQKNSQSIQPNKKRSINQSSRHLIKIHNEKNLSNKDLKGIELWLLEHQRCVRFERASYLLVRWKMELLFCFPAVNLIASGYSRWILYSTVILLETIVIFLCVSKSSGWKKNVFSFKTVQTHYNRKKKKKKLCSQMSNIHQISNKVK